MFRLFCAISIISCLLDETVPLHSMSGAIFFPHFPEIGHLVFRIFLRLDILFLHFFLDWISFFALLERWEPISTVSEIGRLPVPRSYIEEMLAPLSKSPTIVV